MWYLSRTPSSASKTTQPIQFSTNSIFPVSDDGLFTEICIVQFPNHSLTHHKIDHNHTPKIGSQNPQREQQQQEKDSLLYSSWEWFAYVCSPTQFHSVAIPRSPSLFRIQVMAVLPEQFLCAKLVPSAVSAPETRTVLCTYSRSANSLHDVPEMHCRDRNLSSSACAIVDGWLYVAGGFKGNRNPNPSCKSCIINFFIFLFVVFFFSIICKPMVIDLFRCFLAHNRGSYSFFFFLVG